MKVYGCRTCRRCKGICGEKSVRQKNGMHKGYWCSWKCLWQSIDDDLELVNQFRGPNGLNVHKCYGYMASPKVGNIIYDVSRELTGRKSA